MDCATVWNDSEYNRCEHIPGARSPGQLDFVG
jgi:hypothetical protein